MKANKMLIVAALVVILTLTLLATSKNQGAGGCGGCPINNDNDAITVFAMPFGATDHACVQPSMLLLDAGRDTD